MAFVRKFTPPTRKAFDKGGQAVIDDIYRIINEIGSVTGQSRGAQPAQAVQVFQDVNEARTFFQELNIDSLHAVATRTGSLTIDNVLTMSTGSQIIGENYLIEQNDIYLYSSESTAPVYAITTGMFLQLWDGAAFGNAGAVGAYYSVGASGIGVVAKEGVRATFRSGQKTPISLFPGYGIDILDDDMWVMENGGKVGFFGATPVTQQADTTDLKDVLVNFGFLADGGATPLDLDGGTLTIGSLSTSGLSVGYVEKTANYTATTSDCVINCTSGTFTVTLYAASGNAGRVLIIQNSGAGTITVDGNGSETINGSLTVSLLTNDSVQLVCTGSAWRIV